MNPNYHEEFLWRIKKRVRKIRIMGQEHQPFLLAMKGGDLTIG
jgi:hypothetical protein